MQDKRLGEDHRSRSLVVWPACYVSLTVTLLEVLQGSCDVEGPSPSKCLAAGGGDDGRWSIRDGVGVDDER